MVLLDRGSDRREVPTFDASVSHLGARSGIETS
jgi:hypothetical protein